MLMGTFVEKTIAGMFAGFSNTLCSLQPEAIATRLEAIATRLEAIAIRVEAADAIKYLRKDFWHFLWTRRQAHHRF